MHTLAIAIESPGVRSLPAVTGLKLASLNTVMMAGSTKPVNDVDLGSACELADWNPDAQPRVFVVDDDLSVREAVTGLITSFGWKVESFSSAEDFLSRRPGIGPSCLLLDVGLPHLSGLDLQDRLASDRREMPIIFITGCGDVPTSVRAMKAGAAEYLVKPFQEDALMGAIHAALEESRRTLVELSQARSLIARFSTLSRRERQVMALVTAGLLNKQVGARLEISEITVKAHRGRVMEKMQARSLPELVLMSARLTRMTPFTADVAA